MPVKLTELRLDTLKLIDDGGPEDLFQSLLKKAVRDAESRPSVRGKRKFTLEFEVDSFINPRTNEVDEVALTVLGNVTVPKYHTMPHKARVQEGSLMFHPSTPEDPSQTTIEYPSDGAA